MEVKHLWSNFTKMNSKLKWSHLEFEVLKYLSEKEGVTTLRSIKECLDPVITEAVTNWKREQQSEIQIILRTMVTIIYSAHKQ